MRPSRLDANRSLTVAALTWVAALKRGAALTGDAALKLVAALMIVVPLLSTACDSSKSSNSNSARATATSGKPSGERMPLAEYDGAIRHVVIHQPEKLVGQAWRATYDLLVAMPDTTITLVCDSKVAVDETVGRLRQWKLAERANIRILPVDGPLLVWARDRYIAMRRTGGEELPVWLTPKPPLSFDAERRTGELLIPVAFNEIVPMCTQVDTRLVLDGGNIVASRDRVFIGGNVIEDNKDLGNADWTQATLKEFFGTNVTIVAEPDGRVPVAHLDMYVTILDGNRALVGDPRLAKKLIASADEASRKALYERLYITPNMPPPIGPDFTDERIARFDAIAKALTDAGVEVTRIPYADSRGGDFIVTYNNVLQETRDGQRIVYMPIYEIPALDAAARDLYESLGMTVKEINVSTICHLLGAVRCLANVVERGE
jgi:hypothetical protein